MTTTLTLNNHIEMPALGFGVFQTPAEETVAAVDAALGTGYRHIDTAAAYGNEREVGEGIRRSGLDRSELFIETKIWISDYGYDATLHAQDKSAGKLGVDSRDLRQRHPGGLSTIQSPGSHPARTDHNWPVRPQLARTTTTGPYDHNWPVRPQL